MAVIELCRPYFLTLYMVPPEEYFLLVELRAEIGVLSCSQGWHVEIQMGRPVFSDAQFVWRINRSRLEL